MSALIIVDVQHDFLPGGALAVPDGDAILPRISQLLKTNIWDAVIVSKDWHPSGHISFASSHPGQESFKGKRTDEQGQEQVLWPDHCVQNSHGAQLHPLLEADLASDALKPKAQIVLKGTKQHTDAYSAFQCDTPPLTEHLRRLGIQKCFICGLATDYCVRATALGAVKDGFDTAVIDEACRAVSGENQPTWKELNEQGVKVIHQHDIS